MDEPLLPGLYSSFCVVSLLIFLVYFFRGEIATSYWLEEEDTFEKSLKNITSNSESDRQESDNIHANFEMLKVTWSALTVA